MKNDHERNVVKFDRLLGGEQRAQAAIAALAVKMHGYGRTWVTQKNLAVAVLALEGDRGAAAQPEGIAIAEILRVMGPPAVAKPAATIPARTTLAALPAKPLSAEAKKANAGRLLEDYELLNGKERAAFVKQHGGTLKDPASGVSKVALSYIAALKDLPPVVRLGMRFTSKNVGEK